MQTNKLTETVIKLFFLCGIMTRIRVVPDWKQNVNMVPDRGKFACFPDHVQMQTWINHFIIGYIKTRASDWDCRLKERSLKPSWWSVHSYGAVQMIRTWGGGRYGFFPNANFFFRSWPETNLFPLSGKGTSKFPPPYNPIFCQFCERSFCFSQFAEQTIFSSLFAEQYFFFFAKNPSQQPPPPRIIWSAPYWRLESKYRPNWELRNMLKTRQVVLKCPHLLMYCSSRL